MKIKSSIIAVLAVAALAGCASTQKQMLDGKEREVFVSSAGIYAKDGAKISDFNAANSACQIVAFKEESGNNMDRFLPFNIDADRRWILAVIDQTAKCMQSEGFVFVDTSPEYKKTKAKLEGKN